MTPQRPLNPLVKVVCIGAAAVPAAWVSIYLFDVARGIAWVATSAFVVSDRPVFLMDTPVDQTIGSTLHRTLVILTFAWIVVLSAVAFRRSR